MQSTNTMFKSPLWICLQRQNGVRVKIVKELARVNMEANLMWNATAAKNFASLVQMKLTDQSNVISIRDGKTVSQMVIKIHKTGYNSTPKSAQNAKLRSKRIQAVCT